MENSFQTSFIPKKPVITNPSITASKEPVSIFFVIAIILLVLSVLASGGLFAYKTYLNKQKVNLSNSLLQARGGFDKDTIEELGSFNTKSKVAKEILDNHVALSNIFSKLGDITILQVQYDKFEAQIAEKGILTINISGTANDYRSIALQADMFNGPKGSDFKNVLFSNLSRGKDGEVNFNLKFDINREAYSYSNNFNSDSVSKLPNSNPVGNNQ